MLKTGNLFILAEKQLLEEISIGQRHNYTSIDIFKYAIKIRKFLDKHNTLAKLNHVIYGSKAMRREKYLRSINRS